MNVYCVMYRTPHMGPNGILLSVYTSEELALQHPKFTKGYHYIEVRRLDLCANPVEVIK